MPLGENTLGGAARVVNRLALPDNWRAAPLSLANLVQHQVFADLRCRQHPLHEIRLRLGQERIRLPSGDDVKNRLSLHSCCFLPTLHRTADQGDLRGRAEVLMTLEDEQVASI